jgi:hypothetical protein
MQDVIRATFPILPYDDIAERLPGGAVEITKRGEFPERLPQPARGRMVERTGLRGGVLDEVHCACHKGVETHAAVGTRFRHAVDDGRDPGD